MRSLWKQIKAAIGVGLTWSVVWAISGVVIALIMAGGADFVFEMAWMFARQDAMHGFVGGILFAALLRATQGRLRFDQLSLPKFTAWGAFGGFVIGAAWAASVMLLVDWPLDFVIMRSVAISTFLGAATAGGSLALARTADDQELLEAGRETADVGLSPEERRMLLGDPEAG